MESFFLMGAKPLVSDAPVIRLLPGLVAGGGGVASGGWVNPADDQVLATALAAQVDLIVSGDTHLLDLKNFKGIEIVTADVAIKRLATRRGS